MRAAAAATSDGSVQGSLSCLEESCHPSRLHARREHSPSRTHLLSGDRRRLDHPFRDGGPYPFRLGRAKRNPTFLLSSGRRRLIERRIVGRDRKERSVPPRSRLRFLEPRDEVVEPAQVRVPSSFSLPTGTGLLCFSVSGSDEKTLPWGGRTSRERRRTSLVERRCVRGTDLAESRQRPEGGAGGFTLSAQFTRQQEERQYPERGTPERTVQVLTPTSLASQYIWYLLPLI